MARGEGRLGRWVRHRVEAWWEDAARQAATLPAGSLRRRLAHADRLRRTLDGFAAVARPRLLDGQAEPVLVDVPLGTDVIWRPALWRGAVSPVGVVASDSDTHLGNDVALYHDCPLRELILRQVPMADPHASAPYGVRVEVMGFAGDFLSLAIQLPPALIQGLRRDHVVRVHLRACTERPIQLYARLNIRHGPNVEHVLRGLPRIAPGLQGGETDAEFDLHDSEINEKRVESGWLDLIFERPQMNAVTLADVVVLRHPRADL